MVGWHHQLDGHEFEQVPGLGDGQGSLACYSPWGHKELDMTEQMNRTQLSPLCSLWQTHLLELLKPWSPEGSDTVFPVLKEKNFQHRILFLVEISFRNEGKIKIFSDGKIKN